MIAIFNYMNIKVFPRKYFLSIKGTDEEMALFSENNVISIITPEHPATNFPNEEVPFSEKYKKLDTVLVLKFHDTDTQADDDVVLFNKNDAESIWQFVQKTKSNGRGYVVHCTAGLSRSQAVGYVLNEYFNGKCGILPNEDCYNIYENRYARIRRMNSLVKNILFQRFFVEK